MKAATRPTLIPVAEGASPLDVLAVRHRAAWDKTQHGRQEWIEGTLELAAVLAEERKAIPADQAFCSWLERNGLDKKPSHQDRAALIGMATDFAVTREVLEKTDRSSWRHIWENELRKRFTHVGKPRPATKKRSKAERQIIEKVLDLHCKRGWTYDETAEELGLTRGKVAGIVNRNGNASKPEAPPPPKPREFTGLKTLTREQVDPDFTGTDLQFRTKYGHVCLHTKEQLEEHKRQEILTAWLAAVSDLDRAARAFTAEAPDQNTLSQWLAKPGKAERLGAWLTTIETAYRNIAPLVDLVRSQKKT
jgi:hypothetical protein